MAARIVVMAGGTGGHVFPALAVAQELRDRGWDVSWLGTADSFESRVVPEYDFDLDTIPAYRLRGQGFGSLLLAPLRLVKAMLNARTVFKRRQPQVVLGFGGFVTGPGGLVSKLLGIPLVIHEQNSIPGLTNRWLAKVARKVLIAFPESFKPAPNVQLAGNPVRPEIAAVAAPETRNKQNSAQHLLVVGGSLGAQALNETVPAALGLMDKEQINFSVFHQAGSNKDKATLAAYEKAGVSAQVSEFVDDMAAAYARADLVICRAGALTVAELAATGVAAILVPYPYAVDDHQTHNANFLVQADAALVIQQNDLTADSLSKLLAQLLAAPQQLLDMAMAARKQAMPNATSIVADACEEWR